MLATGVLKADGDEHGNREPNSHHLAREILGHRAEPDGHAHQPIAHDALHHRLSEGGAALLLYGVDGHLGSTCCEQARVASNAVNQQATQDVGDIGDCPVSQQILHLGLSLEDADRHGSRVAGEELSASLKHQQQVDREEGGKDRLLIDELVCDVAADDQGQETCHANVATAHEAWPWKVFQKGWSRRYSALSTIS